VKVWPATIRIDGDASGMQRRLQALSTLSNARIVDNATTEPVDMIWLFTGADLTGALGGISKGTLVIAEVSAFKSADESAWFIKECHGRKGMLWPVSPLWHRAEVQQISEDLAKETQPAVLEMRLKNSSLLPNITREPHRYALLTEMVFAGLLALPGKIEGRGVMELYRDEQDARLDVTMKCGGAGVAIQAECSSASEESRHEYILRTPKGVRKKVSLQGNEAVMVKHGTVTSIPGKESFEDIIEGVTRAYVSGTAYGDTLGLYKAHLMAQQLMELTGKKLAPVSLVTLPRFRPEDDPVYMPSIPVARLTAYLQAQGVAVFGVDGDIGTRNDTGRYRLFEDHNRVEKYLRGKEDAELEAVLEPLVAQILADNPIVVGFSLVDDQWRFGADIGGCIARLLKRKSPRVRIAVGGELQVIDPQVILKEYPDMDWVIRGDGEAPLLMLSSMLGRGDREAWSVPGLFYRHDDTIGGNEELLRLKLDHKPMPDFSTQPMDAYRFQVPKELVAFLKKRGMDIDPNTAPLVLPYYYVRGCVHKCIFCGYSHFWDVQSYEKTVAELRELSQTWGTKYFYFLNTTFNMTPRILRETLAAFSDAGLDILFWDSVRPQFFTPERAKDAAKAGLVLVSMGLESGSDAILQRMKKGVTATQAGPTMDALHEAGVINRVNMIPGFIHETQDDIDASVQFVKDHAPAFHVLGCFHGYRLDTPVIDEAGLGVKLRGETLDRLHDGEWSYVYDEVGGLKWEEKKEAIRDSWVQVRTALDNTGMYPYGNLDPGSIFTIYDLVPDRIKARNLVLEYLHANPLGR